MKRIYLCLLATLFTLNSCNDWMDIKPENDQTSGEYWQNKEEVEAVLGAGYVRLRESVEQMLIWGEVRGNSLSLSGFITQDLYYLKRWNILPTNEYTKWGKFYQVINYANMVIKYGPTVVEKDPSFNEAVMRSYLSEAYYLRALSYFYLARNFRDVPLILDPYMTDQQEFELPKSSQGELFLQIIADLETALESSKEVFPEVWETKGRATKWAINATLANVYLWTGEYDKSIAACDNVINSGSVGLINGVVNGANNWFTMFSVGNTNEGIFELQFDELQNQTNDLRTLFSGIDRNYIISQHMVSLFQSSAEDIRGANATYLPGDLTIWKYQGAEAASTESGNLIPRLYSDQNWIIYRMADIYLMKAEALVMQGTDNYDEAIELVNLIRARAGISQPLSPPTNELEMLGIILDERAREFVGEGKRWYDLLRVAQRNNYQYKTYLINQVILGSDASSAPIINSKLQDIDSHYLPINIDELQSNRRLVQNPYYDNLN